MLYTHAAAAIIAAALAATGAWQVQSWRYGEQIARMKADAFEARSRAEKAAQAEGARRQQQVNHAQQTATQRAQAARSDADRALSELDRLRHDIRTSAVPASGPACTAADQRAATATDLLADCAAAYSALARKADGHANDARMMVEAWPK